ncbi:MAG: glutamine-hydrolyzing carbamoyl-phosphate synthase small subunit [Promethearchaeota archaeon]
MVAVALNDRRKAVLVLRDGTVLNGWGFGAAGKVSGEVVFNTATAAGYNCALTDPSNLGQLYTMTYPLIGNYGVPPWEKDEHGITKWFESESIKVTGFIVHECCRHPHHYESTRTLDEFLAGEGIPGIEGIDTRALTQRLRDGGLQLGILQVCDAGEEPDIPALVEEVKSVEDPNDRNLVAEVSTKEVVEYNLNGEKKVVIIDCGLKNNQLRHFVQRGYHVIRVPWDTPFEEVMAHQPDGVFLSNGPGDPEKCVPTIKTAKRLIEESVPTMGICLGNQIIGIALGCEIKKLKFGHRGGNKPCVDITDGRCYITSQNHSFVVDEQGIEEAGFKVYFKNADDHSVEGLYHTSKPVFAVQFHPEAYPGPHDTNFLFDKFDKIVRGNS